MVVVFVVGSGFFVVVLVVAVLFREVLVDFGGVALVFGTLLVVVAGAGFFRLLVVAVVLTAV